MVVHGNGMRVQIVRVVQVGGKHGDSDDDNNPGSKIDMIRSGNIGIQINDEFQKMIEEMVGVPTKQNAGGGVEVDMGVEEEDEDYDLDAQNLEPTEDEEGDAFNAHHRPDGNQQEHNQDHHKPAHHDQQDDTSDDSPIVHTRTIIIPTDKDLSEATEDKTPPPSMFKKLFPSDNRYTILKKDEL